MRRKSTRLSPQKEGAMSTKEFKEYLETSLPRNGGEPKSTSADEVHAPSPRPPEFNGREWAFIDVPIVESDFLFQINRKYFVYDVKDSSGVSLVIPQFIREAARLKQALTLLIEGHEDGFGITDANSIIVDKGIVST